MRLTTCILLGLLLPGCSTLPPAEPPPAPDSWELYQQQARQLDAWQLDGKIGIRTANDSHSARLHWQQQPPLYRILLSGPLGQGGALIEGRAGNVSVEIAGEGRYEADSPEALLQELLGWSVPVTELYYWIRGLPAPGSAYRPRFRGNRLDTLEQSGWLIHYAGYSGGDGLGLPERVRLQRADLTITVIIKTWQSLSKGDLVLPALPL